MSALQIIAVLEVKFRGQALLFAPVTAHNPKHRDYPRQTSNIDAICRTIIEQLQQKTPTVYKNQSIFEQSSYSKAGLELYTMNPPQSELEDQRLEHQQSSAHLYALDAQYARRVQDYHTNKTKNSRLEAQTSRQPVRTCNLTFEEENSSDHVIAALPKQNKSDSQENATSTPDSQLSKTNQIVKKTQQVPQIHNRKEYCQ